MERITGWFAQLGVRITALIAEKLGEEYAREAAPLSAFIGGFIWDALTLTRIDRWLDLTILTVYLAGSAGILAFDHLTPAPGKNRASAWLKRHAAFIFHFFIGGLFSAFVVFMFKSVTLSKSLVFFLMVVAVFVLNEWAARRDTPLLARLALVNLAGSMYLVFVLPLVLGRIDYPVFLLAGLISGGAVAALARALYRKTLGGEAGLRTAQASAVMVVMAVLLNLSYAFRWIPPVPLVLKEASLALHVARDAGTGTYQVTQKETPWWLFWRDYADTYVMEETPRLYVYASVFAPTRLSATLVHRWEWDDPAEGWVTVDDMRYAISGGRDGGYRGYTYKATLRKGRWRVSVQTEDGRVVGRLRFRVE